MKALVDSSLLMAAGEVQSGDEIAISVVTIGELEVGVLAATDERERVRRRMRLTDILEAAVILPVDRSVAARYAELRFITGRRPHNDLWIAATAIAHGLVLDTADEQQSKLPGLTARYFPPTP